MHIQMMRHRSLILWLTVYAICMANVEASLVVHLRTIYYPGNPVEIFPLSLLSHRDLFIELFRELATILMIFSVAVLSVREKHRQFGAFLFVFGLWDLFYYLWLKIIIGWPVRWLEWDVLFLIPWPWLAPWITAAFIAVIMVAGGFRMLMLDAKSEMSGPGLVLLIAGILISLISLLLPAWPLLVNGEAAFRGYMPKGFPWILYVTGYLLMAVGLWTVIRGNTSRE